jgi:hypothetical protein
MESVRWKSSSVNIFTIPPPPPLGHSPSGAGNLGIAPTKPLSDSPSQCYVRQKHSKSIFEKSISQLK